VPYGPSVAIQRDERFQRGSVQMKHAAITHALLLALVAETIGPASSSLPGQAAPNQASPAPGGPASNLPVVFLAAKDPIVSDQRVACTVRIVCPAGSERCNLGPLSGFVKLHGATSQAYPKKSFGINLNAPAPLLEMTGRAHWVLNAAYIDRSLMRHKLAFDLFRSLSTSNAGRFAAASRFVEVSLNGRYQGAYLLMERVDQRLLELAAYQSNDLSHACIYKAVDHAANFGQPGHAGYEQREPDPASRAYWQPLDELNRFVSSAPDAEFFHWQNGIASRLDLDNAIDFHLLVLLTSNLDGITKNFILARNRPAPGSTPPRFFFVPWDYDGTFGRNWDATPVAPTVWLSNHLFDRLLGQAGYRERFAARWNQLREHEFAAKVIQGMIDANARSLGEAARRNARRWPTTGGTYPDNLTFEEDLAQMKSWTDARVKWLDQQIQLINQRPGRAGQ